MENLLKTTRVEDLLAHAEWLRRLAGRLVGEADRDDLVQETWAAALRSPPLGEADDARPWLARVLRNLAITRWRSRTRAGAALRADEDGAAPTAPLSPEELLGRARTERRLADLVLKLDEPFRSTVLLRYYEGKSAVDIGRELNVPAGTVRWRLSEAVDRLRLLLDEEHGGDRDKWRALLLPLARASRGTPAPVVFLAALLALVAGGALLLTWTRATPPAGVAASGDPGPLASGPAAAAPVPASALVEGRVLDPEDGAVAGAQVALVGSAGDRPITVRATSAADGSFRFPDAEPGRYVLSATAEAWAGGFSSRFDLAAGQSRRVVLKLEKGGNWLTGRVLDEGGGVIAGARVSAEVSFPWVSRRFETVSGPDGRYRLMLPPREYAIEVSAPGYATLHRAVAVTRPVHQDLRLTPGARVAGKVVSQGVAVAGAVVRLVATQPRKGRSAETRTDPDGGFVLESLMPAKYQLLTSQGNRVALGAPISLAPLDSREGIVLDLRPGSTLAGRVTDERGRGLAGVVVRVFGQGPFSWVPTSARTGGDGRYRLEGLLPGAVWLRVDGAEAGYGQHEQEVPPLVPGQDARVEVTLKRATALSGRVLGQEGRPARAVLVRLTALGPGELPEVAVITDDDGRFRLLPAQSGPWQLSAWDPVQGIASQPVEIPPGGPDQSFELRLSVGARITGTVRFEGGSPAGAVTVAVTRQDGAVIYDSCTTAADGSFEVSSLLPGRYSVRAVRKEEPASLRTGRQLPELRQIELGSGERKGGVDLVLPQGGLRMAGVVHLSDGSPAAGAQVVAHPEGEDGPWKAYILPAEVRTAVADDGRFAFEDLDRGTYTVRVTRPGLPAIEERLVPAGRTDVELRFPNPATVAGTVRDSQGRRVPEFSLTLLPVLRGQPTARYARDRVDGVEAAQRVDDGQFSVEGLEAGTYELRIATPAGDVGNQVVTLAAGERRSGLVIAVQGGVSITGKVLLPEGGPLAGAVVRARTGGHRAEAETDAQGAFLLRGLPSGDSISVSVRPVDRTLVPEHEFVKVPPGAHSVEVGTIRLLRGPDWPQRQIKHGELGFYGLRKKGLLVIGQVRPDGPAARAGLVRGEVVLAVDGQSLEGLGPDATEYLLGPPSGARVSLLLQTAAGEKRTVELVAESR